jgi:hypothetical protein
MDKTQQYYGGIEPLPILNALQEHEEELAISGFTVLENVLADSSLGEWRDRIDFTYQAQEAEFGGRAALASIGEQDLCRAPLLGYGSRVPKDALEWRHGLVRRKNDSQHPTVMS